MCSERKAIKASRLVNLTREIITLYDKGTGEIVSILPVISNMPEQPPDSPFTYYVVDKKTANRLKHSGRSLKDIAILHPEQYLGRDDTFLNYLLWGEDIHSEVCYTPTHHH